MRTTAIEFPFGQPTDAIIQVAYTVPDLAAGMRWWTDELGIGPWFVNERIGGEGSTYRGEPGKAEFALALAFSGHTMVELIQILDDEPSIPDLAWVSPASAGEGNASLARSRAAAEFSTLLG